jgi:hypothetical protein
MAFVKEELSFIASSDPAQGAININSNGSKFEIALDGEGLSIPKEAINGTAAVTEANVWWVIPNITEANNKFYINGPPLGGGANVDYVITIPKGLYVPNTLSTALTNGLAEAGADTTNGPLFTIQGNTSTNKSEFVFNYAGVTVDLTQPDTPRDTMGFDSGLVSSPTVLTVPVSSENSGAYNQVQYFLVSSDLVSKGIRINNKHNSVIAQIPIDVAAGEQILDRPFNPTKSSAQDLAGARRTNLRFELTDDQLRSVDTNGEYWSVRVLIQWMRPMVIGKVK